MTSVPKKCSYPNTNDCSNPNPLFLSLWAYIDFFDQFEQQTGEENFNREDASATQKRGNSSPAVDAKAEPNKETSSATKEEDDDKEALTDFFDEFEKTTLGEDFRREGAT